MALAEQKCVACKEGTHPLSKAEAEELLKEIPKWALKDNEIEREFRFKDFREAIDFVDDLADVVETQDHHPDICIYYNKIRLVLSTHKIGGLSKNDFILAAKLDKLV